MIRPLISASKKFQSVFSTSPWFQKEKQIVRVAGDERCGTMFCGKWCDSDFVSLLAASDMGRHK